MTTTYFPSSKPDEMNAPASHLIFREFTTPEAGYDYFATEAHYRSLAGRIVAAFAESGIVLVTGEPRAYAQILSQALRIAGEWRSIVVVPCRSIVKRDEQLRTATALAADGEHAATTSNNSAPVLIILSEVDRLSDERLLDVYRSCRFDDPRIAVLVMLASPAFPPRLEQPQLGVLNMGPGARFRLQHLGLDEVGTFILRRLPASEWEQVTEKALAAIAKVSGGDPVVVNRFANMMVRHIALTRDQSRRGPSDAAVPSSQSRNIVSDQVPGTDSYERSTPVGRGPVSDIRSGLKEHGVQRTPDRAALSRIQPEGLAISESANQGASVPDSDAKARDAEESRPGFYQSGPLAGEGAMRVSSVLPAQREIAPDYAHSLPLNFFGNTSPRQVNLGFKSVLADPLETPTPKIEPANWLAISSASGMAIESSGEQTETAFVASSRRETRSRGWTRAIGLLAVLTALASTAVGLYFVWRIYGSEIERATRDAAREATGWFKPSWRRGIPNDSPVGEASIPPAETKAPAGTTDTHHSNVIPSQSGVLAKTTVAPLDHNAAIDPAPPEGLSPEPPPQAAAEPQLSHSTTPPSATDLNIAPPTQSSSISTAGRQASGADISGFVARGDDFLALHDIASARLFYDRAAEAGDGRGALRLGMTFDPIFLKQAGFYGAPGDSDKALFWYRRASDLGDGEAKRLLGTVQAKQGQKR